jgi:hypothetical protein
LNFQKYIDILRRGEKEIKRCICRTDKRVK